MADHLHGAPRLRIGVLGLGMAGAAMVPAIAQHPRCALVGAADLSAELRDRFQRDHGVPAMTNAEELLSSPDVDAIYIATPHQFHREHAVLAARHGKHMVVEKPMALSLEDCDEMLAAAQAQRVVLVVGHTHGFDPAVRQMREATLDGRHGPLAMIAMWNYTDFLYRPRRPEELDTSRGGGIFFNQVPHQVEVARTIANSPVRSVRAMAARLDPQRPTEGCCTAFLAFDSGAAATLVYSGYDHFDSDELHEWIGASGRAKAPRHGASRAALRALSGPEEEAALRQQRYGYGSGFISAQATHQPHCGLVVATYAGADLRITPRGVAVYDDGGFRETAIPPGSDGRRDVLDELCEAVFQDVAPVHGGDFARGTVETCLAIARSAREGCEVLLRN